MNTVQLARQAIRLYPRTGYTDRRAVNELRRGWMKSIRYLGRDWILHPDHHVQRKQAGNADTADLIVLAVCAALSIAVFTCL